MKYVWCLLIFVIFIGFGEAKWSGRILSIWFHTKIDNIPVCEVVLVYPVATFEKMYLY